MPTREVVEKWVAALRSGEYTQAKNTLRRIAAKSDALDPANRSVGFCCLGVLCDVAVKEGVIEAPEVEGSAENENGEHLAYGGGHDSFLPPQVVRWAGLISHNPRVETLINPDDDLSAVVALSELNDMYDWDFDRIADVIAENYLAHADAGQPA